MSTIIEKRGGGPSPGAGKSGGASIRRSLHDRDLYSWVGEQVALLRAGRVSEIDCKNIAEELSDVGEEQYHRLESALSVLLQHMLKWDYQAEKRGRSWVNSILEHRDQAARQIAKNPGLKSRRAEAIEAGYARGRYRASSETGLDVEDFPKICPYSWDEIMTREFLWRSARQRKR